jgi:hypothetical protein
MKNTPICVSFTGFATVTPLLLLTNVSIDILDEKFLIGVCLFVFTNTCVKKGSFASVNRRAEHQVLRNVVDEEDIDAVERSPRTTTRRISARLCSSMRAWRTSHTEGLYLYHIQRIHHLQPADMARWWELCRSINADPHIIREFFSPTRPILPVMESTIQETPIYGILIIHMECRKQLP